MRTIGYRLAVPGDVDALAAMHVQAWREAYRGLMPDAVLAGLDVGRRAATWRETLARGTPVMLALWADEIVGFMGCGRRRNPALPSDGEVYGLYVLARAQRQGIGHALMRFAAERLEGQGFASASLWVFEGNGPARGFYEALGGRMCARRMESRDGWALSEVAYRWDNLVQLRTPEHQAVQSARAAPPYSEREG